MVKIEELKRINVFKDMPEHLLELLASEAQLSIFSTDAVLFRIDEPIDTFYMLLMGQVALKVALTEEIDIILDTAQAGKSFGLSSLLTGLKASSTAICQEPCEVIILNGKRMQDMFRRNEELGCEVMLRLARQYRETMENRKQMIMKTIQEYPELRSKMKDLKTLTPVF